MRDVAVERAAFLAKTEVMATMREIARNNTGAGVTIESIPEDKDTDRR